MRGFYPSLTECGARASLGRVSDMGSARRAKDELKRRIGAEPWCAGVGVEREDGVGFVVRVSVTAGSSEKARAAAGERVGDVVVKILEIDG